MGQQPLVTIVTPTLNQRRFIEATIASVLEQDYPRIEYIVVDGGSTDGTLEVLKTYDGRLTWISEPDGGQSEAINKGFRRAKGEILAWLNSDDTYLPGAVRSAVDHLTANPDCAMVYGDGFLIDEEGRARGPFHATRPFDLWALVYVIDYILQQTAFFRREAVEAVGYLDEDLHWGMDWDLFIKIGKQFRVDYLPVAMGNLREYGAAKTFSGGTRRLTELVRVMRRHGVRRYPPAWLAYGFDTYFRLGFDRVEQVVPARLRRGLLLLRALGARAGYGLVGLLCRNAQGVYGDGWVAPRAHFLLPRRTGRGQLVVRGLRPRLAGRSCTSLRVLASGIDLGRRDVPAAAEEFEAAWPLPSALTERSLIEVELRSRPSFRPSAVPFHGDRRRLSFRLQTIGVE